MIGPHTARAARADAPLDRFECATAEEVLHWALVEFPGDVAYACSFGAEGMVILDLLSRYDRPPRIFTVDTGRLPDEVYDLIERVRARYGFAIDMVSPDAGAVQAMVGEHGPNLFYQSVANRLRCCQVRRVEPLRRALRGLDGWITGIRRDQTAVRERRGKVERDPVHGNIVKIMPLLDWTWDDIWTHIRKHDLPYNPLHDRGYPSIGCAPCTRAVSPGADLRSGRWWWERGAHKECGIHHAAWVPRPAEQLPEPV